MRTRSRRRGSRRRSGRGAGATEAASSGTSAARVRRRAPLRLRRRPRRDRGAAPRAYNEAFAAFGLETARAPVEWSVAYGQAPERRPAARLAAMKYHFTETAKLDG